MILTAIVFSLMPPTGRIFPVRDSSPVIATFWRTDRFIASDNNAVTIVQPALGPSLGVAPWKQNHRMCDYLTTNDLTIERFTTSLIGHENAFAKRKTINTQIRD